jgi:NADH:ubiquinone oxidoreductase subunit 5 (subunit L)/multisubunit Na+/H+ antiporter MnhA subunit
MPFLDSDSFWIANSCTSLFSVGSGVAIGIMALLAAGADEVECPAELTASLLALGITYLCVGFFSLCMAVVWAKNKEDIASSQKQGAFPACCVCCASIAAFVSMIIASVNTFSEDNSDECKDSPRHQQAVTTMILVYIMMGVGCLCGCIGVALTGPPQYSNKAEF